MFRTSLSVIIPAYNEEENIGWVIRDTLKKLPKYFKNFEIIVVDDGSRDKTGKIVDKLKVTSKFVKVIHQANGGYSKAMLTGIKSATKEFVCYMPADGQFLIDDMRHSFEILDKNDLILGYRGGRPDYSSKRIILSYGYLLLLLILFNIKYMDIGWVNIWRNSKLKRIKLKGSGGIFILTEILVKFEKKGYKIAEAPSYYHPRKSGEVKNAKFKVVLDTFLNAFKLWLDRSQGKI